MRRAADTNVIVRLITQDDAAQFAKASQLLAEGTIVLLPSVLLETEWVLRSAYRYTRDEVALRLEALLSIPNIVLADEERVLATLLLYRGGMDFADALHVMGAIGCEEFVSFDKDLVRRASANPIVGGLAVRLA